MRILGLALLLVVFITTLFLTTPTSAAPSQDTINFSARLKQKSGGVAADGDYNIRFKLYDSAEGGEEVWTEVHHYAGESTDNRIRILNGYFSVKLGSVTPFTNVNWDGDLWLTMEIGDRSQTTNINLIVWDSEMNPRVQLSAVPYAMNSRNLGGKSADDFVQLGQETQTFSGDNDLISINNTGIGNLINLQSSGVDAFTLHNSGSITLGATGNQSIAVGSATSGVGHNLNIAAGTGEDGGSLILQGGNASTIDGRGGDVAIDAGEGGSEGEGGLLALGTVNASAVNIGNSESTTTIEGSLHSNNIDTSDESELTIGGSNATGINLGNDTSVAGNLTVSSQTNESSAFQVQNAAGAAVLNVSTQSGTVSTGSLTLASNSLPGATGMGDPVSFWDEAPSGALTRNTREFSVNVGLTFRSSKAGYVTGVKFYNPEGNNAAGTDQGRLWQCSDANCNLANGGTILATATFPANNTSEGWKMVSFSSPVLIDPDRYYVITYHSQAGMYFSSNEFFYNNGLDKNVLSIPRDNESSPRSTGYRFYNANFPNAAHRGSNYWVDVIFRPQTSGDNISTSEDLTISANGDMTLDANNGTLSLQGDNIDISGQTTIGGVDSSTALVVQDSNSANVLAVDTTNHRVALGAVDSVGTLLVLDTKNTAGDPQGVNGAMYYNSNAGKFRCYEDEDGWKDCITPLPVSKVANDNTVSDEEEPKDVDGLSFELAADTKYYYKFVILHESGEDTTGIGFGVTAPTSRTMNNWCVNTVSTLLSSSPGHWGSYCDVGDATTTTSGIDSPGTIFTSTMEGYIQTDNEGGVLQLRMKSENDNEEVVVKSGSFGILQIVQ